MRAVDLALEALDRWEQAVTTGDPDYIAACKRQYEEIEARACDQVEAFARLWLGETRWRAAGGAERTIRADSVRAARLSGGGDRPSRRVFAEQCDSELERVSGSEASNPDHWQSALLRAMHSSRRSAHPDTGRR